MTTRRRIIQSGLALAVLPRTLLAAEAPGTPAPRVLPLERFVYDDRCAAATAVAASIARRGASLSRSRGDLTPLWYDELDLLWKRAPAPLAGITPRAGLFVLETLAADRRMRVVYRGEHTAGAAGTVMHSLAGPDTLLERLRVSATYEPFWDALGAALTECPLGGSRGATRYAVTTVAAVPAEPLVSFIIAPDSLGAARA